MTCTCTTQSFGYDSCYEGKRMNFIYCPGCGEKIREKCPDCGRMEPIDRAVCEKKIENIDVALAAIWKGNNRKWSRRDLLCIVVAVLTGCLLTTKLLSYINPLFLFPLLLLSSIVVGMPLSLFISKWSDKEYKKKVDEYWSQNPEAKADWDKAHEKK